MRDATSLWQKDEFELRRVSWLCLPQKDRDEKSFSEEEEEEEEEKRDFRKKR